MPTRFATLSLLLFFPSLATAQSPHDWHYHGLPNGPTAPGVHAVLGHHRQAVPFYSPRSAPESFGPRLHRQYGWFGRFSPSPRPAAPSVTVKPAGGQ